MPSVGLRSGRLHESSSHLCALGVLRGEPIPLSFFSCALEISAVRQRGQERMMTDFSQRTASVLKNEPRYRRNWNRRPQRSRRVILECGDVGQETFIEAST